MTVAGLTAAKTNIVALTSAQGFDGLQSSGLIGMAFSTISNAGQPTYFENLIAQKKVAVPEFSFWLGRAASGTQTYSQLFLGGRDPTRFTGDVTPVPVTSLTYWQVALDTVLVNGKKAPLVDPTKGQAAIDTGTTLVIAPRLATFSIYARVPGAFPVSISDTVLYAYPCSQTPTIELQFAGTRFDINKLDMSLGQVTANFGNFLGNQTLARTFASDDYCLGSIAGADIDPVQNLYVVVSWHLRFENTVWLCADSSGFRAIHSSRTGTRYSATRARMARQRLALREQLFPRSYTR
jgi:cathepsin D